MDLSVNMNYVLPCENKNHLFDHPLCKNQALIKKICNVAFHVFTLCIPLAVYKVFTSISNSFRKVDLSTLTVEDKRKIITKLPEWFVNHFPEDQREKLRQSVYSDYYCDITGKTDQEIEESYQNQQKIIQNDFNSSRSKTGIALRALTVPKGDPKLAAVVKNILQNSWTEVLKKEFHYADCNKGMMTYDSRAILREALKLNALDINGDKDRLERHEMWKTEAKTCYVYKRLNLSAAASYAFTIGVGKPASIWNWF